MGLTLLSYPKPSKWLCEVHSLLRTAVCLSAGQQARAQDFHPTQRIQVFFHPRNMHCFLNPKSEDDASEGPAWAHRRDGGQGSTGTPQHDQRQEKL